MSKIQVDALKGIQNVKLAPNGNGVVEVKGAGGADGTLALTTDANNQVKIKSPPHSANQSYTMVLPDNNIAQDTFLKFKSVSGTTGQLEYATVSTPDVSSLNASNLTSGTVPSARFPSSFTASQAGFSFESKLTVSSPVTQINHTISEGVYWIIGKNLNGDFLNISPEIRLLNANGTQVYQRTTQFRGSSDTPIQDNGYGLYMYTGLSSPKMILFEAYFSNLTARPWMWVRAFAPGQNSNFESFMYSTVSTVSTTMRFYAGGVNFFPKTEVLFYKFRE
jgi:hypothetical protein